MRASLFFLCDASRRYWRTEYRPKTRCVAGTENFSRRARYATRHNPLKAVKKKYDEHEVGRGSERYTELALKPWSIGPVGFPASGKLEKITTAFRYKRLVCVVKAGR